MNCTVARAQLAAYRRDDWAPDEMRALSEHLATCAACRLVEFRYRQVGESVRQLRTIIPEPSFHDRVMTAIALERERLGPAALRASRATTEPSLPVVRTPLPLTRAPRRLGPVPLAAMVAAAVLLVSLVAMQWMSGVNAGNIAANIGRQTSAVNAQSRMSSYLPDQRFYQIADLRATRDWVAYVASNGSGSMMLYVVDRHKHGVHTILTAPASGHVALVSITAHWVTWTVTSAAGWTVSAAPLTGSDAWRAQTIMQDTTSTFSGAWASDNEALVAYSAGGEATLQRMSLSASATSAVVIATGSHPGAVITSPSMTGGTVYWADVWADMQGALHSAIWSETAAGPTPVTQAGGEAYSPLAVSGTLTWISATHALTAGAAGGSAGIVAAASQASGKLMTLSLKTGQTATLASETPAASVRVGGSTALWMANSKVQGYDLSANRALSENSLMVHAQVAGVTGDALSWFDGSHIVVYELR